MKYFLDTEFIEGFHQPYFGKRRHHIDLISIGIVREDGKEYYGISTDFDPRDANDWVKENVISKLPERPDSNPSQHHESRLWKSQKQITLDLLDYFGCFYDGLKWDAPPYIEIYGYYADYDWVLFCSLFGRMIDLPRNFPMYCRDLKQISDEIGAPKFPKPENEHSALDDAKWNMALYAFLKAQRTGMGLAK